MQDFMHLLERRRSIRHYTQDAISQDALIRILTAGQGITNNAGGRAAPSAHALYPLSLYVLARRVDCLEPGLYTYSPSTRQLIRSKCLANDTSLIPASLADDTWLDSAAAVTVIAADQQQAIQHFASQQPDGLRGLRYIDFEAGATAQNMHLQAICETLGSVVVMGVNDQRLHSLLQLPEQIRPVALLCIGVPD